MYSENILDIFEYSIQKKDSSRLKIPLLADDYRGEFKPWDHYIPLEEVFTNWNEIVILLRDDHYLQDLADRAFSEIVESGRWDRKLFVEKFDDIISLQYTRNQ